jgi:hypothetical protein
MVKMSMNEKDKCQVKNKRSVQVADRIWRKRMRKEIGFKLFCEIEKEIG